MYKLYSLSRLYIKIGIMRIIWVQVFFFFLTKNEQKRLSCQCERKSSILQSVLNENDENHPIMCIFLNSYMFIF